MNERRIRDVEVIKFRIPSVIEYVSLTFQQEKIQLQTGIFLKNDFDIFLLSISFCFPSDRKTIADILIQIKLGRLLLKKNGEIKCCKLSKRDSFIFFELFSIDAANILSS